MAASTSGGFTEELICSVCLETFNTPVLLPCAHSFCRQCLFNVHERSRSKPQPNGGQNNGNNAINSAGNNNNNNNSNNNGTNTAPGTSEAQRRNDGVLVCPQCRLEIKLGPEGIAGLPKNTSLANIIMSVEEEKKANNILCEVCDDEPARVASKKCSDCSVTYCVTCFRQLHPMRGAFKYHVIKEANAPINRCASPVFDVRAGRFTPSRDGYGTDGAESGDDSGVYSQDQLESVRRQIKSKRKELSGVNKAVQNLLKTTEDETEERMREIRSTCSQINESVGEREAAMLTTVSQKRHEAVRQCLALSSEVKAQTLTLDLLEDQVNDIIAVTAVHTGTDVTNDVEALKEKVSAIHSRSLIMRAKLIPRQPKLGETELTKHIARLDFVKDNHLLCPVLTEFVYRPVSSGPALVEVKWRSMEDVVKFKLAATQKDPRGNQVETSVDLAGSTTSYQLCLPCSDTEYHVSLHATAQDDAQHPVIGRTIRTLPYVHCFKARFSPTTCHKRIAVSASRDEVVHRKCKLSNLHNACAATTSFQRLEHIEGAIADEALPLLPHLYWEAIIHFRVFGKLGNSKLLCDLGVVKQGCEDGSSLLCDNFKSYCSYLVRRQNKVTLEFWNGPDREILPRSIPVLDLDNDQEKTIKLAFYLDALKRKLAIVSPGNNSVLCQFNVRFPSLVPMCGLYCFDQVYVMVKFTEPQKIPNVLSKLMKQST
ncbi:E3 ubiquitin-protein ligase TRIM8 [Aplysia californica]|uniref:E3 ubiquitin-protein ligase TRIM8 n=1 Tax=Aplysia californica TaxID=6500 RepID=A0ABM1A3I8_APLCA|nr:E3 ubiquitin-protein ligase TRIM8 [Aplysia californica]